MASIGERNRIHRLESAGMKTGTGGQYTRLGLGTSGAGSPDGDEMRVSNRRLGPSKNHQDMEASRTVKAISPTVPRRFPAERLGPTADAPKKSAQTRKNGMAATGNAVRTGVLDMSRSVYA